MGYVPSISKSDSQRGLGTILKPANYDIYGNREILKDRQNAAAAAKNKKSYRDRLNEINKTTFDSWEPWNKIVDDMTNEYIDLATKYAKENFDNTGNYDYTPEQQRELNKFYNNINTTANISKQRQKDYARFQAMYSKAPSKWNDVSKNNMAKYADPDWEYDPTYNPMIPAEQGIEFQKAYVNTSKTGGEGYEYDDKGNLVESSTTTIDVSPTGVWSGIAGTVKSGDRNKVYAAFEEEAANYQDANGNNPYVDKNGNVDAQQYSYDLFKGNVDLPTNNDIITGVMGNLQAKNLGTVGRKQVKSNNKKNTYIWGGGNKTKPEVDSIPGESGVYKTEGVGDETGTTTYRGTLELPAKNALGTKKFNINLDGAWNASTGQPANHVNDPVTQDVTMNRIVYMGYDPVKGAKLLKEGKLEKYDNEYNNAYFSKDGKKNVPYMEVSYKNTKGEQVTELIPAKKVKAKYLESLVNANLVPNKEAAEEWWDIFVERKGSKGGDSSAATAPKKTTTNLQGGTVR